MAYINIQSNSFKLIDYMNSGNYLFFILFVYELEHGLNEFGYITNMSRDLY